MEEIVAAVFWVVVLTVVTVRVCRSDNPVDKVIRKRDEPVRLTGARLR